MASKLKTDNRKMVLTLIILASLGVMLFPQAALAADVVTGKIDSLNNLIMAIIADELHTPINELRFISIREVKEEH